MKVNHITPLPKPQAVRVFLDDRENGWLFFHLMREYIGARDEGHGESLWAFYLRRAMVCIKTKDEKGLEESILELVKLSEQ